jgi:hypothetical protein
MERLSDPSTRAYKWRQLAFLAVAVAAVLGWQYFTSNPRYSVSTVLFLVAGMAVAVTITLRRMFWYLADDVFEEGPVLVARRSGTEARVPFEDIIDVYAVNVAVREGIAVQLRSKVPPFGERIVFRPPSWESVDRHQMDEIAAGIKSRIALGRAA